MTPQTPPPQAPGPGAAVPGRAWTVRLGSLDIVIRRGFLLPAALVLAIGALWGVIMGDLAQLLTAHSWASAAVPSVPTYAAVVFVAFLGMALLHEAGHAAATVALTDLRPSALTLQLRGLSVRMTGDIPSGWRGGIISAAGPLAEMAGAAVVLVLIGGWWQIALSPVGFAAAVSLLNGLCNLLVSTGRNSDAARIYRALLRRPQVTASR